MARPLTRRYSAVSDDWLEQHAGVHVDRLVEMLGMRTRNQVYYLYKIRGLRKARKRRPYAPLRWGVEVVRAPVGGCVVCGQRRECERRVRIGQRLLCETIIDYDDLTRYRAGNLL